MNTRRKFLRNTGIVVSAALVLDPLSSMAKSAYSSPEDSPNNTDSIILLHTNHGTAEEFSLTAAGTSALAGRADNIVLLNAPDSVSGTLPQEQESKKLHAMMTGGYSASLAASSDLHIADTEQRYAPFVLSNAGARTTGAVQPVRIITKGNIKIGIIGTALLQSDALSGAQLVQEVNRLAKNLKEENGCRIVACLSSLGYKTTGAMDDARLAKDSVNVDVIISAGNSVRIKPHVALTNNGSEVLIDNAGSATTGVGRLEIGFDGSGSKNHIAFGSQALSGSAASVAVN